MVLDYFISALRSSRLVRISKAAEYQTCEQFVSQNLIGVYVLSMFYQPVLCMICLHVIIENVCVTCVCASVSYIPWSIRFWVWTVKYWQWTSKTWKITWWALFKYINFLPFLERDLFQGHNSGKGLDYWQWAIHVTC